MSRYGHADVRRCLRIRPSPGIVMVGKKGAQTIEMVGKPEVALKEFAPRLYIEEAQAAQSAR